MKKLLSLLLCLTLAANLSAQQGRQSLYLLMTETNRMTEIYSKFKPGGVVFHCFKEMELKPHEIERLKSDEYFGRYLSRTKDSISVFAAIELFRERISDNLHKIVTHPDFYRRMNKRQTLQDLKYIRSAVSEDARLFNFTFDSQSGAAVQMQTSVMHFLKPAQSGSGFTSWSSDNTTAQKIAPSAYKIFSIDGYSEIYLLNKEKSQYLLIGHTKTGAGNYVCYADVASFKNGFFVRDFEYRTKTNKPENCIVFNKASGTLNTPESTFVFDGTTFVRK